MTGEGRDEGCDETVRTGGGVGARGGAGGKASPSGTACDTRVSKGGAAWAAAPEAAPRARPATLCMALGSSGTAGDGASAMAGPGAGSGRAVEDDGTAGAVPPAEAVPDAAASAWGAAAASVTGLGASADAAGGGAGVAAATSTGFGGASGGAATAADWGCSAAGAGCSTDAGDSKSRNPETRPRPKTVAKDKGKIASRPQRRGRAEARDDARPGRGATASPTSRAVAGGVSGIGLGCPGSSQAGSTAIARRTPSIHADPPGTVSGGSAENQRSKTHGRLRSAAASKRL